MSEEVRGRRFLIATGVTTGLSESAARLQESVASISGVFEEKLGYERVTPLRMNPAREEMRRELNDFAMGCTADDYLVLYHTGHADIVAEKHRLWMGDTEKGRIVDTLLTSELAELLLADTPVSNLLIILDTCFAGLGGTEFLATAFQAAEKFKDKKSLFVITAAYPRQQVRAGDFAFLFQRAVDDDAIAGRGPRFLPLRALVSHMEADEKRKPRQDVTLSVALGPGDPPFLLNPRYNPALDGLDQATQDQLEQDAKRREDMEGFFSPRAHGVEGPEETGWNFVGRHTALRELAGWLGTPEESAARVVTGGPGSGKSAVIGRLAVLADPDRQGGVPRQGIPPDTVPPTGSIDVAVHARNRAPEEILQALSAAAHVTAATPGEFLRARRGKPMVAAIDAIDEAVDPERLVTSVLNPLIEAGPQTGFRLLLGTRRNLLRKLSDLAVRIDLDDKEYADSDSIRVYAERMLRATRNSPYLSAAPGAVRGVSEAVAQAAGPSFLVALITSRTLAALDKVADPADPLWVRTLPGTAADAMRQDLEYRLREEAVRALDLLRPLAYAGGNGLPREDIWAELASALSGRDYRDERDVLWLRRNAGSYVVEAVESDRSVYRLYHTALAEYLRQGQDSSQVNRQFVASLLKHVPVGENGERDWQAAHPYIRSHLARHAADAGELAGLTSDPGYLVSAERAGLLAAFGAAGPETQPVAAAYERAVHRLQTGDLASSLSYLEFAARRSRAEALAERIARYPVRRTWSVDWTQSPRDFPHRVLAGHRGPVREVVGVRLKDHGPMAASAGDDGSVRLWDLVTGEQLGESQVSSAPLAAVDVIALREGGPSLAVLSADGMLTTLGLPSLSRGQRIQVHLGVRNALHMTQLITAEMRCQQLPDGRWAAVTGGPGMMTAVWDIEAGTAIIKLSPGIRPASVALRQDGDGELVALVRHARLSDTETHVYYPGAVRRVRRFPSATPEPGADENPAGRGRVKHAVPSERFPFQVRVDGRVMKLSPVPGLARARRAVVLSGHGADITDAAVVTASDGSAVLVSSSVDGTVRLWDAVSAGAERSSGGGPLDASAALTATAVHRDRPLGLVIATTGTKLVEIVDLGSGEQVTQLRTESDWTLGGTCGHLPEVGDAAVTFTAGGRAGVWALPAGGLAGVFPTHVSSFRTQVGRLPFQTVQVALPGRPLAITGGHGSRAIVWDLVDGRIHNVLSGHTGVITALACAATDQGLPVAATAGQDNKVNIWDVISGRRIACLRVAERLAYLRRGDSGTAQAVCLTRAEGRLVVLVLCEDGRLRILRQKRRGSKVRRVTLETNGASCLAVLRLPGGRLIAMTGAPHGQLCAWDVAALLAGDKRREALLLGIETELSITGLTVTGIDTVVASTLTGLAAFRFETELLGRPAGAATSR